MCYRDYRGGRMGEDGRVRKGKMEVVRFRQGQRNRWGVIGGLGVAVGMGMGGVVAGLVAGVLGI